MKRKPILNFFDISCDVEDLPENELFQLNGGASDSDGTEQEPIELEEVVITAEQPDPEPEPDFPEDPEDPFDTEDEWEEPDWWDDSNGGSEENNEEEEKDECTCSRSIVGMGEGLTTDSTNLVNNLNAALAADLKNPAINQTFKDTLNSIQTTLNRIGDTNFNLVVQYGDAKGSGGLTTLRDNTDIVVTLDSSQFVYSEDVYVLGTLLHKKGDINYAAANNVLVHELKHVEQFLDGRIGFDAIDNEKVLSYGVEDEVEAFAQAENYSTLGNPEKEITAEWVKRQEITVTGADGTATQVKPYENLGNGGNCPIHGVSSNPNP